MKAIIVALDEEYGFGRDGGIPWTNKEDMKHFREITAGCTVVMGYRTYASIGKPLNGRLNVVIARAPCNLPAGVVSYPSIDAFFSDRAFIDAQPDLFIIGGLELYRAALDRDFCDSLFITHIKGKHRCDRRFDDKMIAQVDRYLNVALKPISGGIIARYDRR